MNEFVDYLNTTNNMSGNSTGSLAESQVKSSYYDLVKVDRKLGDFIVNCVASSDHHAFILTGHAGDGKTSILVQVLKKMDKLKNGDNLCVEKEYSDFFYVKDMSEIPAKRQVESLYKALKAPSIGKTSLLISNTGPLLKAFDSLVDMIRVSQGKTYGDKEKMGLQSALLSQMDTNLDSEIKIEGFSFYLINIARIDNVQFSKIILKKIITPQLWTVCSSCPKCKECPIKNNQFIVLQNYDRVSAFIENYYRYLYENDKRMTIRQMVGQISYAITGNLSCQYILSRDLREPHFNYNFANLFFGYIGLKPERDSVQIKGIEEIQNLGLDHIALDVDYQLFVRQDYSCFPQNIAEELKGLSQRYRSYFQITEEQLQEEKEQEEEIRLRCSIRRFYLMFSLCENKLQIYHILDQIFGRSFTEYCDLILSKQDMSTLNKMRRKVFDALYIKNTGMASNGDTNLSLTLRREDDVFQNVMIILGELDIRKLKVTQVKVLNKFEDLENKYDLYLVFGSEQFKLSFPMITYFNNLINGSISSNNNPALTHGIAQLDTLLLEQFGNDSSDLDDGCELKVIISTTKGQDTKIFSFDGGKLEIQ